MMHYIGNCVIMSGSKIQDMVDNAREITYRTFCKYADPYEAMEKTVPPLHKDYAVSFYKSKFEGKPCVYFTHSCIEFVFQ